GGVIRRRGRAEEAATLVRQVPVHQGADRDHVTEIRPGEGRTPAHRLDSRDQWLGAVAVSTHDGPHPGGTRRLGRRRHGHGVVAADLPHAELVDGQWAAAVSGVPAARGHGHGEGEYCESTELHESPPW